jgi:uncharacterized short protein YbdD (DUF466 family)
MPTSAIQAAQYSERPTQASAPMTSNHGIKSMKNTNPDAPPATNPCQSRDCQQAYVSSAMAGIAIGHHPKGGNADASNAPETAPRMRRTHHRLTMVDPPAGQNPNR